MYILLHDSSVSVFMYGQATESRWVMSSHSSLTVLMSLMVLGNFRFVSSVNNYRDPCISSTVSTVFHSITVGVVCCVTKFTTSRSKIRTWGVVEVIFILSRNLCHSTISILYILYLYCIQVVGDHILIQM